MRIREDGLYLVISGRFAQLQLVQGDTGRELVNLPVVTTDGEQKEIRLDPFLKLTEESI